MSHPYSKHGVLHSSEHHRWRLVDANSHKSRLKTLRFIVSQHNTGLCSSIFYQQINNTYYTAAFYQLPYPSLRHVYHKNAYLDTTRVKWKTLNFLHISGILMKPATDRPTTSVTALVMTAEIICLSPYSKLHL